MSEDRRASGYVGHEELVADAGLGIVAEPPNVRLGSGTAWAVAMQVVTAITSVFIGLMVSRALGPSGKGTLSLMLQSVAVLLVLGDLGLSVSTIYYVSKGDVRPGTVLGNGLVILAAVSLVAFLAILGLFRSRAAVVHLPWADTLAAFSLFVLGLELSWAAAIAVGVKGVKGQAAPAILGAIVTTLLVSAAWAMGVRSVIVVIIASCFGSCAGLLLALMSIRSVLRPVERSMDVFRLMASYSAKLYVGSAADFLHFRQDVLMLGWMVGVGSVGVYSVGVSIAELATRLPAAMGSAILAQASRVSHESALDLAARAIRLTALFALVAVLFIAAVAGKLIPLLFGGRFAGAVTVFYLLAPGILANALIWPISSYQSARGIVYWRESSACVVLNIALNLVLIPLWGYLGAAVASSVSYATLMTLLLWRLCRDSGLGPGSFLVVRGQDVRVVVASARTYLGPR